MTEESNFYIYSIPCNDFEIIKDSVIGLDGYLAMYYDNSEKKIKILFENKIDESEFAELFDTEKGTGEKAIDDTLVQDKLKEILENEKTKEFSVSLNSFLPFRKARDVKAAVADNLDDSVLAGKYNIEENSVNFQELEKNEYAACVFLSKGADYDGDDYIQLEGQKYVFPAEKERRKLLKEFIPGKYFESGGFFVTDDITSEEASKLKLDDDFAAYNPSNVVQIFRLASKFVEADSSKLVMKKGDWDYFSKKEESLREVGFRFEKTEENEKITINFEDEKGLGALKIFLLDELKIDEKEDFYELDEFDVIGLKNDVWTLNFDESESATDAIKHLHLHKPSPRNTIFAFKLDGTEIVANPEKTMRKVYMNSTKPQDKAKKVTILVSAITDCYSEEQKNVFLNDRKSEVKDIDDEFFGTVYQFDLPVSERKKYINRVIKTFMECKTSQTEKVVIPPVISSVKEVEENPECYKRDIIFMKTINIYELIIDHYEEGELRECKDLQSVVDKLPPGDYAKITRNSAYLSVSRFSFKQSNN